MKPLVFEWFFSLFPKIIEIPDQAHFDRMSPFQEAVHRIVARIPEGKVTSYGAVAAMAGQPRAARGVGWILNRLPPDTELPWWRVVNREGGLSTQKLPTGAGPLQRARLEGEGVRFDSMDCVSEDRFWWRPDRDHSPSPRVL
jgi:methylated-DNA-protein-cysteine methyltransferase-like protein